MLRIMFPKDLYITWTRWTIWGKMVFRR